LEKVAWSEHVLNGWRGCGSSVTRGVFRKLVFLAHL
jgi:hypothetical protein